MSSWKMGFKKKKDFQELLTAMEAEGFKVNQTAGIMYNVHSPEGKHVMDAMTVEGGYQFTHSPAIDSYMSPSSD